MSALDFTQASTTRRVGDDERARILAAPGFGQYYSDFMVHARWTLEDGWGGAEIVPFGPLQLSPAAAVLHYGQEIFEGLKAFRHADGSVWTFRPERNAERMQRSARRLALPELPHGGLPGLTDGAHRRRRALGARGDQRGVPVPAPLHVRQRGVPRGARLPLRGLLRDRLTRGPLLPPRRPAFGGLDLRRVRAPEPGGPVPPSAAATTPPPCWRRRRPPRTAPTRSCSWTPRPTPASTSSRA